MKGFVLITIIFFITLALMYGEARYTKGRSDLADEILEKYEKEERNN